MILSPKLKKKINNIKLKIETNKSMGLNSITIYCHACYAYKYKKYFEKLNYNVRIVHDESEEFTNTTITWGDINE